MLFNIVTGNQARSDSPSFSTYEISDPTNDWGVGITNGTELELSQSPQSIQQTFNNATPLSVGNLIAGLLSSNGKTLNVDFWFDSPLKNPPAAGEFPGFKIFIIPNPTEMVYQAQQGYYTARLYWNGTTWKESLNIAPSLGYYSESYSRVLSENATKDINTHFSNGSFSARVSIDLGMLNYPESYGVELEVYDSLASAVEKGISWINDNTKINQVPIPQVSINTSPNLIQLRPGEKKSIEIKANSTAISESRIRFFTNQTNDLISSFSPSEIIIAPHSFGTALLNVKASDNARIRPVTLPILATTTIARTMINKTQTFAFPDRNTLFNNTAYLSVIIENPLTLEEKFAKFWDVYGDPINLIFGGFAGGFAALMFERIKKPH
jgi:hypothetical protein